MKLSHLLAAAHVPTPFEADIEIQGIACDSRRVQEGYLFAAIPGNKESGLVYVPDAIRNGAVALLTQEDLAEENIPVFHTPDIRQTLALMASAFYKPVPETMVAVTGTNGKTSTVFFTRQIFESLGFSSASMGTLGTQSKVYSHYTGMTTTDCVTLHEDLQQLALKKVTHVAMEASSHGLDQHRLDGLKFKASAFTNLTRDHLDYHLTMEKYLEAKLRLFTEMTTDVAVLNADIPEFEAIRKACLEKGLTVYSYGHHGVDLKLIKQELHETGQKLTLNIFGQPYEISLPITGNFQGMNILAALGLAIGAGIEVDKAIRALANLKSPPGRMELVATTQTGATIFVDYAHTPDGLETALKSIREHTSGRLFVVFGCGGNRDAGKRPMMGKIAHDLADVVIVTDDNPRFEEAAPIRSQIIAQAPNALDIADRSKAIFQAIQKLQKGDTLLIAGKGHEEGQLIKGFMHPFNDKIQAILAVRSLEEKPLWTSDELVEATSGKAYKTFVGYGVSIDTRTLQPGDIYIALKGEHLDGHDYVVEALKKGAVAAIVNRDIPEVTDSAKLFFVVNTDEALQDMAKYAVQHSKAKRIGITGSSGKTTSKEMLIKALKGQGIVHATQGNLNNQWGVPLTLARLPRLADYAIIEMGMNHTGEMEYLSHLVHPDVVMITMIGSAHRAFFKELEDIAAAKAEIFLHMQKDGTAVLNRDSEFYPFLKSKAFESGIINQISFGQNPSANIRLLSYETNVEGTKVTASIMGLPLSFTLQTTGLHFVMNALGVLGIVQALKADVKQGAQNLALIKPLKGRGERKVVSVAGKKVTLIDDSYNANPSSMQASLHVLGQFPGRKIAVLGDMLELGDYSRKLHTDLKTDVTENKVDKVYTVGPEMKALFDTLDASVQGKAVDKAMDLLPYLKADLQDGDVILLKGSNGTRIWELVAALQN